MNRGTAVNNPSMNVLTIHPNMIRSGRYLTKKGVSFGRLSIIQQIRPMSAAAYPRAPWFPTVWIPMLLPTTILEMTGLSAEGAF